MNYVSLHSNSHFTGNVAEAVQVLWSYKCPSVPFAVQLILAYSAFYRITTSHITTIHIPDIRLYQITYYLGTFVLPVGNILCFGHKRGTVAAGCRSGSVCLFDEEQVHICVVFHVIINVLKYAIIIKT